MPHRRRRVISALLQDLRIALHRLGREILVCLVLVICTWQLLWEVATRLVHALF
ncbi:MAG TPA: hypothetical protein VFJ70_13925 [Burkholderiales bacterium]|nr:hypothetical protein [Burkholderiales bacterium]